MKAEQRAHLMELGLIIAIPGLATTAIPKGRISNIYKRLTKHLHGIIKTFPQCTMLDKRIIEIRISEFAREVAWERKELDITILLSFVLELIETSNFKYPVKILDDLNDAFEFLSARLKLDDLDIFLAEAERAAKIWKEGEQMITKRVAA